MHEVESLTSRAAILRQSGRDLEADNLELEARNLLEKLWADWNHRGVVAEDEGDYRQSERCYLLALTAAEKLTPKYGRLLGTLNCLTVLYDKQGRYKEAEQLCKRSLDICQQLYGIDHAKTAAVRWSHSKLHYKANQEAEASLP